MVVVVEPPEDERPSVAIIGAGPSGLATAHHLAESHRVWLFDTRSDVGGVWAHSSHQAYPWLETNTPTALFPFPGFPMVSDDWVEENGEASSSSRKRIPPYVSGQTAQRYYARFAKEKNLTEIGRLEGLRLSTKVIKIERPDRTKQDQKTKITSPARGCLLTFRDIESGQEETQPFDRIVIATGSFSAPSIPKTLDAYTPNNGNFLYHSSDLGSSDFDSCLMHASKVVIIGGGKSALDLIAFLLTRSSSVGNDGNHRRSIVLLLPPHQHISALPVPHGRIPSYLSRLSLFGSRYLSPWSGCSSASSSSSSSPIGLEKSRVGQILRRLYWSALSRQVSSNYAALFPHPSKDAFNRLSMLQSTARLFPAPRGLCLSSQKQKAADISVLRGTLGDVVTSTKKRGETALHLTLGDGSAAQSITLDSQKDIIVACTGYLPSSSSIASLFEDERDAKELGIPTTGARDDKDADWNSMVEKAIDEARSDAPLLEKLYTRDELCHDEDLDTFRLYQHMVPLEQAHFDRDKKEETSPPSRDFAVIGLPQTLSASIVADVQARWLARFFSNDGGEEDGSLRLPGSQEEAAIQTSRLVAASISRYGLRDARQGTTMSLELAWYCNSLLSEMEENGARRQTHPLKALGADDFL